MLILLGIFNFGVECAKNVHECGQNLPKTLFMYNVVFERPQPHTYEEVYGKKIYLGLNYRKTHQTLYHLDPSSLEKVYCLTDLI